MDEQKPAFHVREIPVYGDLILSPMDGFSDQPFRKICRDFGSAMSYTEFTSCDAILHNARMALKQLEFDRAELPQLSFQIFDADEDRIVAAAQKAERLGPGIIDLNMGCSVSGVSGRGAGAGLLKDPAKIGRIFYRMSRLLKVPVTGKIRLGWDAQTRNYREVARVLEDNGAQLIAVHGRTREQAYKGNADWDAIAEVKQTVKVPVIGNGDVKTVADIARIKAHTGCDGVMIGRAAIGNPWIFARKDREQVTIDDTVRLLHRHLEASMAFYGEKGLILFRKHAVKYIHAVPHAAEFRERLMTRLTVEEFHDELAEFEMAARLALAAGIPIQPEQTTEGVEDCADSRCELATI
ncbi:MAG: tRNA dihydrouridine synthase DusB [Thermoflexales bacterium]|nr:tRNA dihydrouridine synthase DusB [Thermoflexales bacterium]